MQEGKYSVSVRSNRMGSRHRDVWGEGDNFEDAFRNAIDELDSKE